MTEHQTALQRVTTVAQQSGWTVEFTGPDRRLFFMENTALIEIRFGRRERILDAIYYHRGSPHRDQYVMSGDQGKAETVEWVLRTVPVTLRDQPRGPLHYNNTPTWTTKRKAAAT